MKINRKPGIHLHATKKWRKRKIKGTSIYCKITPVEEYYWIIIAKNGKTIAKSSETYKRKASAVKSIYVAASIFLDCTQWELIPYYDHTLEGTPIKYV